VAIFDKINFERISMDYISKNINWFTLYIFLGFLFNNLLSFGIYLTNPLFISIGILLTLPLAILYDYYISNYSLGVLQILGVSSIFISFIIILFSK
jgi:drug/metabolite transporter (DMT)-like permease